MGYKTIPMPELDEMTALFKISLFSDLESSYITKLRNLMEFGQSEAGECIRPRGDNHPALFIVYSGHVQLRMFGNPVPIADLRRGQAFGMLSFLFSGEAIVEALSVEPSSFFVLEASTLRMLEISSPQLALLILKNVRNQLSPIIYQALPIIGRSCLK